MDPGEQQTDRQRLADRRISRLSLPRQARRGAADWSGERAAIYCRISHADDDDQTGVDRQERICRDTAERLNLTVPNPLVFVDNNRSAWKRNRKRPGWDALLEAVSDGQVRHILTYHPDRLMRQPHDLEQLLHVADEHDITLHGQANRRDLADPDDRFFLRIEVAHACRSSDDTSRRLRDATVDRARDGQPHGGKRRYGYDKSGTAIIAAEAAIVRAVFTRYLEGETPTALARDLNERNERTALGREWNADSVRALLDSHHVAGIRVFRGEEVGRGQWPAIINEGLWQEVHDRRTYRAPAVPSSQKENHRFYLLRGIVMCKRCGVRMAGSMGKYLCGRSQRTDSKFCGRSVSAPTLEAFVTDAAINLLERLDVTGSTEPASLTAADQAAIEADEQELAELKDMWETGELKTREYRAMRKTVEDRVARIRRKLVVRPAVEVLEGLVGPNARRSWKALKEREEYERMNAVLRFLFGAVIIDASSTRGRSFDFGRVDIEPNEL
ncbi:recombinase family protein [Streptomyces rhizosphaerihabitans]|uniref:recombinase family protein n=1 Tax=Streptomyces rhizosphaerihabitans TaxID=1266770 RepID=UPI0021C0B0D8|nr:recombinase family protein [Streptomyces rhizosphaerihabitans]MCT9007133.1 recombinase family protein [Streptomyces rhizosphaerihabitans]